MEVIINLTPIVMTLVFGTLAASFSYMAYHHTKERFRLELFEKRWGIYQKTLAFCSGVTREGGIPKNSSDKEKNERVIEMLMHG